MTHAAPYPIGSPGTPWGETEKAAWRARQVRQRSYADDVLAMLDRLRAHWDVVQYGELDYPPDGRFPLLAIRSPRWDDTLPVVLVTGGVHGYETSGVQGALRFALHHGRDYTGRVNLLVAPCISPWAYERVQRWNADAVDPNRSFRADSRAAEAVALMHLVAPLRDRILAHIDLHETTDSDESEFRPALAARDGEVFKPGTIPDGFYLVDDAERPQPAFQQAILEAVAKVTHIAPADPEGDILGSPVSLRGVLHAALKQHGLCAGMTDALYRTTTEVYPDSPRTTPQLCELAQVTAVCAGIAHALAQG